MGLSTAQGEKPLVAKAGDHGGHHSVEKPSLVWPYNGPHQSAAGKKIAMYL